MPAPNVECLRCGTPRAAGERRAHRLDPGECPRCGYLGWAHSAELSETARRRIRRVPPERRVHLHAV